MENTAYLTPSNTSIEPSRTAAQYAHLNSLDFLRGFAALSVVLFHFTSDASRGGALVKFGSPIMRDAFSWGYLGVEIFFVISGFIIPYSLYRSDYHTRQFKGYLLKRIIRICPPAYLNIFLIVIQLSIVDYFFHHTTTYIHSIKIGQVVSNLLFIVPATSYRWINGVFWTLAVEFQFYIILGFAFNLLYKNFKLPVFTGISVLLILLRFIPGLDGELFFKFSPFFTLGGVTLLFHNGRLKMTTYLLLLGLFTSLASISVSTTAGVFGLLTALFIAFVNGQNLVFKFLGTISYSLYLTHLLVGSTTEFLLSKLLRPITPLQNILGILVCTGASIAFAYVYFLIVEKPFIKLAKRLL